jgi:peroxidase
LTTPAQKCFKAGEFRPSENLNLASVQTLFMREHNRIAVKLKAYNPTWNDTILYYEARRINLAQYQNIIYK